MRDLNYFMETIYVKWEGSTNTINVVDSGLFINDVQFIPDIICSNENGTWVCTLESEIYFGAMLDVARAINEEFRDKQMERDRDDGYKYDEDDYFWNAQ